MEVLLCERVNDLHHSLFHLLNCLIMTASELRGISKSHREQGLDYREAEELSWCPSWSNSLWQGWSCGLVHCHGGNATDPIWRVLASSDIKTDAQFMQDAPKAVLSIPYIIVAFFPSLKQYFIAYRSSKVSSRPDCIFEIHQLWQSGFSMVYSNCCCSCSFEPEIIKLGQSIHKMYKNNILNFQESTTILNV